MNLPYLIEQRLPAMLLFFGVAGSMFLYAILIPFVSSNWFDSWDFTHYFIDRQGAIGQGALYKEIYSDYLLLANLLFGVFYSISEWFCLPPTSFQTFT